jgi:DDE superfamily endonuclease
MSLCSLPPDLSCWVAHLAVVLDARVQGRLAVLVTGLLFAKGRRTVTSWLRAAGVGGGFRRYYDFLAGVGRRADVVAVRLLLRVLVPLLAAGQGRLLFGLDDTPTKRAGPKVQGAGLHHNPTPGPADQKFLYGHVWVTLAWLAQHRLWGAIALPLLARRYVRQKDMPKLPRRAGWAFRTKLELAAGLVRWLAVWLGHLGQALWLVADGAYAKRPLLKAAREAGVVVVSRLRKDARLRSLPPARRPGQRGRPAVYGRQAISLAKRAGQKRGWQTGTVMLYRAPAVKTYKTFLATWRPAGGVIRVVLVRERGGWVAFFCTDAQASAADILSAVADRGALEQAFHDLKEVWGAGQQQLRRVWANVGAYHLNLWLHTLTEAWAWARPQRQLTDRVASPWDDSGRRPSHADRRKALQRLCLRGAFQAAGRGRGQERKMRRLAHQLIKLVV